MIEERHLWKVSLRASAALVISAVMLALPTAAWAAPPEEITDGQQIAVTLDLRHFGNVLRINEDSPGARRRGTADDRLITGLDLIFARELGRNKVKVKANAGYDFYRKYKRLNRARLGAEAGTGINLGPCLVNLDASFERRQSDLETQSYFGEDGGFQNTQTVKTYGAEARCGRSYGLRPMVGYHRTIADNSDELRALSSYRSERMRAGITWSHPVMGRFAASYDRTKVRYPNRAGTVLDHLQGYENDAIRFAAARDIGTLLRADASVSYVSLKPNNASAEKYKGVSWRVGATANVGPRLMLNLTTESTLSPSLQAASAYSRNRSHELRATYAVSSRMSVSASGYMSKRKYFGVVPIFGPVLEEDSFRRISAQATMKLGYRLSLTVEAGNERRNGTGDFYDYSSNFVGLNARFTY